MVEGEGVSSLDIEVEGTNPSYSSLSKHIHTILFLYNSVEDIINCVIIQYYSFKLTIVNLNFLQPPPPSLSPELEFKNFCSSCNSLNPTLRPNLRPNSDDSLRHVVAGCKIIGSTEGVRPDENKTDLGWF